MCRKTDSTSLAEIEIRERALASMDHLAIKTKHPNGVMTNLSSSIEIWLDLRAIQTR